MKITRNTIRRVSYSALISLVGIASLYIINPSITTEYTPAPIEINTSNSTELTDKFQISIGIEQKVQVQLSYMISEMKRKYGDNSNYNQNNPDDKNSYDSILGTIADDSWIGTHQFENYLKTLPREYIAPELLEEWKSLLLQDVELELI